MKFARGMVIAVALAASTAWAEGVEWLQYDATMVQDEAFGRYAPYALFLRYHLNEENIAGEVVHYEPSWNSSQFLWIPSGMAFHSDADSLTLINTFRDTERIAQRPMEERPEDKGHGYSAELWAYSESEMLARIERVRRVLQPSGETTDDAAAAPVSILRDADGRIQRVSFPGSSAASYAYGADGGLEEMAVTSQPVEVPIDSSGQALTTIRNGVQSTTPIQRTAVYHAGGRATRIVFEDIDINGATVRMPVQIEVHRGDNGDFVRSARHDNFLWREQASGEPLPWETWPNASLSERESDRIWILTNEGYWVGDQEPTPEHRAFYESFVKPLDELERAHPEPAFRLRAFYHAYIAAMVVGDEDYLRAGFPWYLEQLAGLESPPLLLHAGQDCIRLLMRWGYDDVVETAFPQWRDSILTLDEAVWQPLLAHYAEHGVDYYAFELFRTDEVADLTDQQRFRFHAMRCQVLQRLGQQADRELSTNLSYATEWWANITQPEWAELVADETAVASEHFAALTNPTADDERMQTLVENLQERAEDGEGFAVMPGAESARAAASR